MAESLLAHADERLGHVAVDMGFMTMLQVDQCRSELMRIKNTSGIETGLGDMAVDLGFITNDELKLIEEEEHRRRRLISGYEIIDLIGSGTIATVYRAVQRAMDREVALKILHPRLASDPEFVKAYIAEAQSVSRFHHPHIVQGIDVGESNGFIYFAHEYLSGGSLATLVKSDGPLSEGKALLYLRQTTSALRHAWEVAVFHGDLNPGNLLLDSQGNIKLANLGVPRIAKPRDEVDDKMKLGFVRCGPEYAAPEQLEHPELVNAATDIYNLGAAFYHLSFGIAPFSGNSIQEILDLRRQKSSPSFTLQEQGKFSPKFVKLIHDMLEPDPANRPPDPENLALRLEKFHIAGENEWSGLARKVRQPSTHRRRPSSRSKPASYVANPDTSARRLSLKRRTKTGGFSASYFWAIICLVVLIVLAALFLF